MSPKHIYISNVVDIYIYIYIWNPTKMPDFQKDSKSLKAFRLYFFHITFTFMR